MFKLNNNGWSLGVMIGLLCILVFFLLLVAVLSYNTGIEKGSPHPIIVTEEDE